MLKLSIHFFKCFFDLIALAQCLFIKLWQSMPLELVSRIGNASWDATISREQAARLQLRKACRPLPRYRHFEAEIENIPGPRSLRSTLTKSGPLHLTHEVPIDLRATMWAGKSLEDNPKMWAHVMAPRSELFSRGAFNQLTSHTFSPKTQAEKMMRATDPGVWPQKSTEFSLPNHMLSYPETGQWLLWSVE